MLNDLFLNLFLYLVRVRVTRRRPGAGRSGSQRITAALGTSRSETHVRVCLQLNRTENNILHIALYI